MRHPSIILLMAMSCGPTKADMLLAMEPVQTGVGSLYEQLHQQQVKFSSLEAADLIFDVASGKAVAIHVHLPYTQALGDDKAITTCI